MTNEEARRIVEEHGYDIEEDLGDGSFWVFTEDGLRLVWASRLLQRAPVQYGKAPSIKFVNRFPSGRSRYITHGLDDTRDIPCIEDYADDRGRKHWKDYVQIKDRHGNVVREGPKPFRSEAERRSYEKLTGLRHRDTGEAYRRK